MELKMSVLIFSRYLSDAFPILRRLDRDVIINVQCFSVQYTLFLSDCYES